MTIPISSPFERIGRVLKFKAFIFSRACEISAEGFITATFFVATSIAFIFLNSFEGFFVIVQRMSLEAIMPTSFLLSEIGSVSMRAFVMSFAHFNKESVGFAEITL